MLIYLINADYMTENGGFIINEKMVFFAGSKDLWDDEGSINLSKTASFVEEEDVEVDTRCVC